MYKEVESGGVWKPKIVGDTFEGVLKSRKVLPGKNNQNYTQFTFEQEGTGEEFKLSGAVLENKLNAKDSNGDLQIPDGTKVLLTYKGMPKGTYLDFSVMAWTDEDEKPEL